MKARVPIEGRERARRIDGVVLIDKPSGVSSNVALQRVKRAYRANKAGHTGTLDPLATGLLPICLGEATKFSQVLIDSPKVYRAQIRLGVTTETGDAEGCIIAERPVAAGADDIERVLGRFRGDLLQVPHRYSAIKHQGRPLYAYARAGESVAAASRPIRITALDIEQWSAPMLSVRVACSKGTYIRSLAEDIGEALGCGAHVAGLRRLATGRFVIDDAIELAALEVADDAARSRHVLPLTVLVDELPKAILTTDAAVRFSHGLAVRIDDVPVHQAPEPVSLYIAVFARPDAAASSSGAGAAVGEFIGLAREEARAESRFAVPFRLLATGGA